jgi:hypothetical protein
MNDSPSLSQDGTKWFNSVTIHPPGGDMPTLTVAGNISATLDLIGLKGRNDNGITPGASCYAIF